MLVQHIACIVCCMRLHVISALVFEVLRSTVSGGTTKTLPRPQNTYFVAQVSFPAQTLQNRQVIGFISFVAWPRWQRLRATLVLLLWASVVWVQWAVRWLHAWFNHASLNAWFYTTGRQQKQQRCRSVFHQLVKNGGMQLKTVTPACQ